LYVDARIINQWWRAIAVGLLFFLAALCKEMAVGFALALPVWHFFHTREPGKAGWREYIAVMKRRGDTKVYLAIIISGLIYLFLRDRALGMTYNNPFYAEGVRFTFSQHLALVGLSIFKYMALLLFPLGKINVAHALPTPLRLGNYQAVLGYVILFGFPLLAYLSKKHSRIIIAGFFIVLASLFPVSGILPVPRNFGMYFSETFLPFPVAIFTLVLAGPISSFVSPSIALSREFITVIRSGLSAWLLLALFTVWSTIPVWNNNISLWLWAKSANPQSIHVSENLSSAYLEEKRYEEAVTEAARGVKLDPMDNVAWNYLALGLNGLGHYQEAETAAQKAINLNPVKILNRVTLARIYYFSKNYNAALMTLKKILNAEPDDISSLVLIANVYKDTEKLSQARRYMQLAIDRLPAGQERTVLEEWLMKLN